MATVAWQETMGQPGQRTLLPFFGKNLSSSRAKPLDGREEEFTTESAAIQNDDVGDTSRCAPNETEVNNVVGEDVINVGNPQRSNSKRGGDRKHNSDMDSSVAACEKQESGRRKRRKTKKHSHTQAKAEESALQNGIYGTTSTPDAFKDHTGQANSATDASANFPDSSTNATPGGTAGNNSPGLSTPRETKTLRLNPNGKLLSSPRRGTIDANDDNDDATNQKRKLCGGPKDASKTSPLSLVACISYGKDENSRQSIGGLIDQVLLGNRRNERPKQRTEKRSPPSGPPKATHPFFLSKPTQSKASCPEQPPSRSQVSEQKDDSREPPVTADSIVQQRPPPPSGTRDHSLRGSSNQGRATKPARSGETREPVWPPSGIVHIRGSLPPAAGYDVPASRFASYQGRKAKGFTSNVPQSESVLSMPHLLTANENRGVDVPGNLLHQPEQVTCRGSELRDTTVTKISNSHVQGGRVSEGPDDSGHKKLNRPHPALTSLIDSIPTAKSSFERGECGDTPWIQKYAPKTGEEVLQLGPEAVMLRSWLQNHEISAVNTGNTTADAKSTKRTKAESGVKRKRHKRPKDLDSFIVSSSDEEPQMDALDGSTGEDDELAGGVTIPNKRSVVRSLDLQGNSKHGANDRRAANTVLLSGPSGCGKTAAVYAVARELGFEIFEINPGSRRSARDVVERVGDMTQNHLVHLLNQIDHVSSADSADPAFESTAPSEGQNTMKSFFKKKPEPASSTQQKPHASAPDARDGNAEKQTRNQKQSLILLEEVDILFEQDKHFWNGVHALMSQSKRPIIMTCNEEHLLPTDDVSLHAIFRFRPPSRDIAVDYLLLMAANEGHVIDRQPISELYTALGFDLRATIMHLDFWCQMAVGSKKSGLDWLVNCPSRGASSPSSDLARAVSCRTYGHGMGWYNHDMAAGEYDSLEKGSRLMMDCHDQWNIGIADWNEAKKDQSYPDMFSRLDALMQEDEAATVKSALDCICPEEDRKGPNKDSLDVAAPDMPERDRANYVEGYSLIQADRKPDFTRLSTEIAATLSVLLENCLEAVSKLRDERSIVNHVLDSSASRQPFSMRPVDLQKSFEEFIETCDDSALSSPGHRPLSSTHGVDVTAEDLAPYVRAIVAFDLRLERTRHELSGSLQDDDGRGSKRVRTTRASRAALEGGSKATTRRERWFPGRLDTANILATGGRDWQDILLERETETAECISTPGDNDGDSSSDGGI